jgi:uncharacterized Zn finger protein
LAASLSGGVGKISYFEIIEKSLKMPTLKIAESLIRQNADNKSFERGRDYARSNSVSDLVWRGQTLRSSVVGNEYYRVTIGFSGQSKQIVQDATCSCPYDFGGWCKHIVATLLVANDQGNIEERPSLAQLLERLNLEQTRKLLDNLVVENPDLIDQVDLQVELLTAVKPTKSKSPKSQSSQNQRPEIDRSPFRRNVRSEIRDALRSIEEDYIEEDPFIDVIDDEIQKATGFIDAGDSFRAFVVLYATAEELAVHRDDIDDYSDAFSDLVDSLDRAIAEAILWTDFSIEEREKWASELEGTQDLLGVELEQSFNALLQGWDDPRLLAILAGELDHNLDREIEQLKTVFCELGYVRLNVLESQDRFEEYLCFAEILGFLVPYVTMLIQLERLEQAIESAEKLENHEQAFAIAQKFLEHGSEQEALRTAHKGLQLLEEGSSAHYATELAVWTAALAEQLGETKILLNAKIIAFKFNPSLADYHEIRDLTGDKWNSTKEILLKYLSKSSFYGGGSDAKVDIFLDEGLIDQAIAVVEGSYCSRELRLRVMQVAAEFNPQWVISKGKAFAEDIINRGKSEYYEDAVKWLEQVKRAYLASKQEEEWRSYRQQLVEVNSKKRKLMEIVKRKGL